jgi:hypothetical protein
MRNVVALFTLAAVALCLSGTALGAQKQTGTTKLVDVQPAGTPGKGQKHQQYDFTFEGRTHEYTCRSKQGDKINATDFVVGSNVDYQVKGNKGKVKSSTGKEVSCTIVRVADLPTSPKPAQ